MRRGGPSSHGNKGQQTVANVVKTFGYNKGQLTVANVVKTFDLHFGRYFICCLHLSRVDVLQDDC